MTRAVERFEDLEHESVAERFLAEGYVIVEAENRPGLDRIRALVADTVRERLGVGRNLPDGRLLDAVHEHVTVEQLNELRLSVIQALRAAAWFRPTYYSLARGSLHAIVGNELAMQRSVGLNVQLPHDDSSLLPIHCDVWDGDSPFEVVLWVPLVDCYRTKSMFILPLPKDRAHQRRMAAHQHEGSEALYHAIEADARFLDIPYGRVLLFSQTLMHGNRVNRESETRWSLNARFKSAMSPYADKKLGEFFDPISLRPATRIGLDYEMPGGFVE